MWVELSDGCWSCQQMNVVLGVQRPFACCQTAQQCGFKQSNEGTECEFLTAPVVLWFKILCPRKIRWSTGVFPGCHRPPAPTCAKDSTSEGSKMFGRKLKSQNQQAGIAPSSAGESCWAVGAKLIQQICAAEARSCQSSPSLPSLQPPGHLP